MTEMTTKDKSISDTNDIFFNKKSRNNIFGGGFALLICQLYLESLPLLENCSTQER